MDKIGIFCSACEQISPRYFECTRELGVWMATEGKTLVYGGADMGLMECIAHTVKEHGGKVVGVVPTKLEEKGRVSDLLDVTFHTVNLSDRKDVILQESDILVALPGGVGFPYYVQRLQCVHSHLVCEVYRANRMFHHSIQEGR